MKIGTVKWFINKKGYGFIIDENQQDVFVHYSEIQTDGFKTLHEGATVLYDTKTDDNGRTVACNVREEA